MCATRSWAGGWGGTGWGRAGWWRWSPPWRQPAAAPTDCPLPKGRKWIFEAFVTLQNLIKHCTFVAVDSACENFAKFVESSAASLSSLFFSSAVLWASALADTTSVRRWEDVSSSLPGSVVDQGVLHQGEEDKQDAHPGVDINSLNGQRHVRGTLFLLVSPSCMRPVEGTSVCWPWWWTSPEGWSPPASPGPGQTSGSKPVTSIELFPHSLSP